MSKLFYKQDCVGDGLASCPSVSTKKSNFLMSGLLRMWQKKKVRLASRRISLLLRPFGFSILILGKL